MLKQSFEGCVHLLLQALQSAGYRRYRGACYEQIVVEGDNGDKQGTHAWRRACSILDFIKSFEATKLGFENTPRARQFFEEYLLTCTDAKFPELRPDRHLHAFKNGIYNTNEGAFYPWGSPQITADSIACAYHDHVFDTTVMGVPWFVVSTPSFHKVLAGQLRDLREGSDDDAMNDDVLNKKCDWAYREEVIGWIYTLMGRLLFEVGEKDEWQVIPFVVGDGEISARKLLNVVKSFFNQEDVGELENTDRLGQFYEQLQTVNDKHIWHCDFTPLDQARLHAMVAGEEPVHPRVRLDQFALVSMVMGELVSIVRKHKESLVMEWKAPGILTSSEMVTGWNLWPAMMARRLVVIPFEVSDATLEDHASEIKKAAQTARGIFLSSPETATGSTQQSTARRIVVTPLEAAGTPDSKLDDHELYTEMPRLLQTIEEDTILEDHMSEIKKELPRLLHKCCMAYLSAAKLYGHKDLWGKYTEQVADGEVKFDILPAFFHANKHKLQAAMEQDRRSAAKTLGRKDIWGTDTEEEEVEQDTRVWKTTGILSSNEAPSWEDNVGSIQRSIQHVHLGAPRDDA